MKPSDMTWLGSSKSIVVQPAVSTEVAGASSTRRGLVFSSDGAGACYVGTAMQVVAGNLYGFALTLNQPSILVPYEWFGTLVQQPWLARAFTGAVVLTTVEIELG